ncbi:hypothetical protein [Actinocorallia longicatena]|uniref:DivIVA domain-containing protein n=1 Tax=Actinocorallia longicatena TaxID=111803 RepID=A0ABP6QHD0_9ACTN
MPVVLVLAALAVVAATVALAYGRGGELSEAVPDHPPTGLPSHRPLQGTDAALLRLPKGLWGYNIALTDDALSRLAYALTERETRIGELERLLGEQRLRSTDSGSWSVAPPTASWLLKPEEWSPGDEPGSVRTRQDRPDHELPGAAPAEPGEARDDPEGPASA